MGCLRIHYFAALRHLPVGDCHRRSSYLEQLACGKDGKHGRSRHQHTCDSACAFGVACSTLTRHRTNRWERILRYILYQAASTTSDNITVLTGGGLKGPVSMYCDRRVEACWGTNSKSLGGEGHAEALDAACALVTWLRKMFQMPLL